MDFSVLKEFMDRMARERAPGNAVTVYLGREKIFEYASGVSDLENKSPLTGEELYNIYSCTKVLTATAGAQMLEQGRFLLSDPLYAYIPEYRHMQIKTADGTLVEAKNPITIGDLFSMTVGFNYFLDCEAFKKAKNVAGEGEETVSMIRALASEPLRFEPGTHWHYGMGHDVLAAVISVITGKKYRDYVKESILDPLDMTQTYFHHTKDTLQRTAQQYQFVETDSQGVDVVSAQAHGKGTSGYLKNVGKENVFNLGAEFDSGGAGIISSVPDYAKLMAALANYGTGLTGERILSPYTIDLMRTNRLPEVPLSEFNWEHLKGCGYGLGVRTHMNPGVSGLICNRGEFGWGGAAGASVIVDPKIGLGVFYAQHVLNPREGYYQPRLRNLVYTCL